MSRHRIIIRRKSDEDYPIVDVNVNGNRVSLKLDTEAVVDESVIEALKNATEPKTVKESTEEGPKTIDVPRFIYQNLGVVED